MTLANPSFSPSEFELRNFTNKYLTPEQQSQVTLVESRVQGQLDFLGQFLGWSGANYWTNLPATVSQKRQLLGGSYGVYNSFLIPRIISAPSWSAIDDFSSPQSAIVEIEKDGRIQSGQIAYLGEYSYPIASLTESQDRMYLDFGFVDANFFNELNNNTQLKIDARNARPAPFHRPSIGVSGDRSFVCRDNSGSLTLYPSYDTNFQFPYLFPILFAGSTYSFDKPVYLSYSDVLNADIKPSYNEDTQTWFLTFPDNLESNSLGGVAFLVWGYSNSSVPTNSVLQVKIQSWSDPSDWNSPNVLQNFLGAWGNKGGPLPFNLAFDSLSLHGFSERNSLYLPEVFAALEFNEVVDLVYSQRALVDYGIPGNLPPGKLWYNSTNGVLAVQVEQEEACPVWIEVSYREAPEQELVPEYVFPDVPSFIAGEGDVPEGTTCVLIVNAAGISPAENIVGLESTIPSPSNLYVYRQPNTNYWVPVRFLFETVADFDLSSPSVPYNVPVYILNSDGLGPSGSQYTVSNLRVTVSGSYETVLVKENTETEWTLFPDSILRFIPNSGPYGMLADGDLWWDFDNPDPQSRAAMMYLDSGWTPLNSGGMAFSAPEPVLDMSTVLFYCNGKLLSSGEGYLTDDYQITYVSDPGIGQYTVSYKALSMLGKIKFPTILISDSLTSSYKRDITEKVFGGVAYRMSPNVYDAETPLRLWKSQHLQVSDTLELIERNTYANPLVADQNTGPALDNWQRYFVRLPLDYGRNGAAWQKAALICQDFAYYGSTIQPENMDCPPGASLPKIYEEVVLGLDRTDYTYIYSEPFLYSTVIYNDFSYVDASYTNAAIRPTSRELVDDFQEAQLIEYDPLHNRLVDFSPEGYGNWLGVYLNISACNFLSGYYVNDLVNSAMEPIEAPLWDASIYKCPPTCDNPADTYSVDSNSYKVCYAYFVADASAAEDGFFDPQQEVALREPVNQVNTLYVLPPSG